RATLPGDGCPEFASAAGTPHLDAGPVQLVHVAIALVREASLRHNGAFPHPALLPSTARSRSSTSTRGVSRSTVITGSRSRTTRGQYAHIPPPVLSTQTTGPQSQTSSRGLS